MVNTSLFETALMWAGQKISAYVNQGKLPERHASGHPNFVPYQAFDCADGPLLVCCGNDRLFRKFADVLGRRTGRPIRASPPTGRGWRTRPRCCRRSPRCCAPARAPNWPRRWSPPACPCAPVNSIPEVLAEPQTAAMEMLQPVPGEDFSLVAMPLSFDGERPRIRHGAPRLGETPPD